MKNMFSRLMHDMREKYDKWLTDMAKENKKTFGDKRMDCCDLNKSHHHDKHD